MSTHSGAKTARDVKADETMRPYSGLTTQYIGGVWRTGGGTRSLRDKDPYTGEVVTEIPLASVNDVTDAYEAAAKAQKDWASRLPAERAGVMLTSSSAGCASNTKARFVTRSSSFNRSLRLTSFSSLCCLVADRYIVTSVRSSTMRFVSGIRRVSRVYTGLTDSDAPESCTGGPKGSHQRGRLNPVG